MQWPHIVAVDKVDPGLGKGRDVLVPGRLSRAGSIDAGKDDDGWSSCPKGFANQREGLIVGDPSASLGRATALAIVAPVVEPDEVRFTNGS